MFTRFFSKDYQRKKALARVAPGPLADYLATPLPDPATVTQGVYAP